MGGVLRKIPPGVVAPAAWVQAKPLIGQRSGGGTSGVMVSRAFALSHCFGRILQPVKLALILAYVETGGTYAIRGQ